MNEPSSFVIRIYRRDAESFAGLVEDVQAGRAAPFRSLSELCDLLSGRKPFPRRTRRAPRTQPTPLP